jgi:hypothetical protein
MSLSRRELVITVAAAMLVPNGHAAAGNTTIVVHLPHDRRGYGQLKLLDAQGISIAGPFKVYGMADPRNAADHHNPGRSPLLLFGDTPTGTYRVGGFLPAFSDEDARRHGPNGKIVIIPSSGDARLAASIGRIGLEIHGGYLAPGTNKLRPTNGCLRLRDDDMVALLAAVITSGTPPDSCSVSEISVSVIETGADTIGQMDGDPPPDIANPANKMPKTP